MAILEHRYFTVQCSNMC